MTRKSITEAKPSTLRARIREHEALLKEAKLAGDENAESVHERMITLYRMRLEKLEKEGKRVEAASDQAGLHDRKAL